jgi:DNA recombination protein RmuC
MANLATLEARILTDFDAWQTGIGDVVAPVKESLQRMGEWLYATEFSRGQAYGALSTQLESLVQTQGALWSEAIHLVKALRVPALAVNGVRSS